MTISSTLSVSASFRRLRAALAVAAVALLAAACASTGTPHGDLDRYLGRPLAAVKDDFGAGYREEVTADGRHVVTWAWRDSADTTGYRPPSATVQLGHSVVVMPETGGPGGSAGGPLCEYTFYAGADGVVDGWEAFGPACSGSGGVAAR